LVAAVLGLRHIFSAPAGQARLFGAEKTSHSGERYVKALCKLFNAGVLARLIEKNHFIKFKYLKNIKEKYN